MTSPTTHQPEQYTDVRCDNVVWDKHLHENRKCNRLLFKLRPGEPLVGTVLIECPRCGKRQGIALAKAA